MTTRRIQILLACISTWTASQANAQLVLNEILENPPGRGADETGWEFIELLGAPGLSLDEMCLLVIKGGADDDRDGVPELSPEIDEVFWLDGLKLGENGLLTLVGTRADGESPIADRFFEPSPAFEPSIPASRTNLPWIGAVPFSAVSATHAPSIMRLDNHGSSTYLLVRIDKNDPGRASLARGAEFDTDFDGRFDRRFTHAGVTSPAPTIQIIDEIAWSNRGGREYVIDPDHEISETHGLNPDAISRLQYFPSNPRLGSYTRDRVDRSGLVTGFEIRTTTIADESFLYGVLSTGLFPASLVYFNGYDIDGWPQLKGPTDRHRTPYGRIDRDPEPDSAPIPPLVRRDPDGTVYLDDLVPGRYALTPGRPNPSPIRPGAARFELVPLDLNFDGAVTETDVEIASAFIGATGADMIDDPDSPTGSRFRWQGPAIQQLMLILGEEAFGGRRVEAQDVARVSRAASR